MNEAVKIRIVVNAKLFPDFQMPRTEPPEQTRCEFGLKKIFSPNFQRQNSKSLDSIDINRSRQRNKIDIVRTWPDCLAM